MSLQVFPEIFYFLKIYFTVYNIATLRHGCARRLNSFLDFYCFGGEKMLFKRKFMDWGEYIQRVESIERMLFVSKTAEQSIRNYWSKRG